MVPQEELNEYRDLCAKRKKKNAYLRSWRNDPAHPERVARDRVRCRAVKKKLGKKHLAASKRYWLQALGPEAQRIQSMIYNARKRARNAGVACTLTIGDITIPTHCPVLGTPLNGRFVGDRRHHDDSPSLDRIDCKGGYTPGNVVVISWRANALKRDASLEEMEKIVAFYRPLLKK